jgi:hypothetical protein
MAALTLADRVAETTTTTGTGTLTLGGIVGGAFRTFVAGAGDGAVVPYVLVHRTANEWEVGYGTVTDATPDTLSRTAVYASSNANALVNFSAGTKDVFLALPASRFVHQDTDGNVGIGTASPDRRVDVEESVAGQAGIRVNNTSTANSSGVETLVELYNLTNAMARVSSFRDTNELRVNNIANGITSFYTNNTERTRVTADGNLIPGANNAYSFGDGSTRWTEIFAVNGTINTSDANAKTEVEEDVPSWDFVQALRPVSYRWKVRKNEFVQVEDGTELIEIPAELDEDGNEIAPARTEERPKFRTETIAHPGVRRHLGFIAQEVKDALGDADYGMYTYNEDSDEHGLRYDQFAPVLVKALQEAMARIESLEARLDAAGL